jgi:L-fuconolactonase
MKIDAHQHFWRLAHAYCTWPTPTEKPIYRDFEPGDLAPLLKAHDIAATILVQAAPDIDETRYLLSLADAHDFIAGVVGWIDMQSPRALVDLGEIAEHPKFKGIRPMLQALDDPLWVLDSAFDDIFKKLVRRGLTFDALVQPRHLEALRVLAARYPDLAIVIDHGAKPQIRDGLASQEGLAGWAPAMSFFRDLPNVSCKLSGLVTEASPGVTLEELRPYLDHLYTVFGSARLMWGSDWPVVDLAMNYETWIALFDDWLADKSATDQALMRGGTAARVYSTKNLG